MGPFEWQADCDTIRQKVTHMKTRSLVLSLAALGLLAACGGGESSAANQQAYETVQEGSVAGVTSTIQGPGETLPPITNTNADTTTAFTLDPNAVPPVSPQTAGLPPATASGAAPSYDSAPAPTYRPPSSQPAREPQPAPRAATQTPREPEREPVTPPQTSTATPQPREPQPEPEPAPEPEPEEPAPPTTTNEEPPPPPPPTQTDTEGGSGQTADEDRDGVDVDPPFAEARY